MNKFFEAINKINLSNWIIIGLIIFLVIVGKGFLNKSGLINQYNQDIDKYKNQLVLKDQEIANSKDIIKDLDKKNKSISKNINKLNKRLSQIEKGNTMDDAIINYRSSK